MFNQRGRRNARSLLVAIEFVEMFVPNVARPNAEAQKNAAARFVHRPIIEVGSQYSVPYMDCPADAMTIPINENDQ